MAVNSHISQALAHERAAELRRDAAAHRPPRGSCPSRPTSSERRAATGFGSHPDARTTRERPPAERITALVAAAAESDRRAWNGLIGEFGGMIGAVARAHGLRDADAADVSQATWLRLLEHLGQLNEPARVGAWLATTARRECLRVLRESKRGTLYGDDAPEHKSSDPPPDDGLLVSERDEALWQSFSRLRGSDQTLLRLLVADPRPPYEEIAAALKVPIGSIGPTRQRALERLRRELAGQGTLSLMTD